MLCSYLPSCEVMRFPLNTNICSKHCRSAETPKTTCWKVERPQAGLRHYIFTFLHLTLRQCHRLGLGFSTVQPYPVWITSTLATDRLKVVESTYTDSQFFCLPCDCQDCSCLGHGRTQGSGIPISLQVSSGSACQWIASTFGIFLGAQRERERSGFAACTSKRSAWIWPLIVCYIHLSFTKTIQ